jgi:hypothetical protein
MVNNAPLLSSFISYSIENNGPNFIAKIIEGRKASITAIDAKSGFKTVQTAKGRSHKM